MTLIERVLKTFSVALLFCSATAVASDLIVDTTIDDSHDAGAGGWKYDIEKMDVQWAADDTITVDVYTNFVDYNNKYSTYDADGDFTGKIVLGDLLISTDGDESAFDYAFVISDADREEKYNYKAGNHWEKTGNFTEITSTQKSNQFHQDSVNVSQGITEDTKNDVDVEHNIVVADGLGDSVGSGLNSALTIDRINASTGFDKISFSFNVGGVSDFQSASQLAFSWGMSCANDIVSGVVSVNRPSSIPEPSIVLLMLAALGFMANQRKKV